MVFEIAISPTNDVGFLKCFHWWQNFEYETVKTKPPTKIYSKHIDDELKKFRCKLSDRRSRTLEFDSETDASFFILKWS
jgi:hypothetical protein